MPSRYLTIRHLGVVDYQTVWDAMVEYVNNETSSNDELWLLQHPEVYTRGLRSKETPDDMGRDIPLIATDRGGLITYHGPGQLILYCLINLRENNLTIKELVANLEQCVINLLANYQLNSNRKQGAPGVYVDDKKIASIGLRIRNKKTYHGLSINLDMDLTPFQWIDPCGFEGLEMVQLCDLITSFKWKKIENELISEFIKLFHYCHINQTDVLH